MNGRECMGIASGELKGGARRCRGTPRATLGTRVPRENPKNLLFFQARSHRVGTRGKRTHRADVHELAGANIVGADDERTGVVIEERAEAIVVRLLGPEKQRRLLLIDSGKVVNGGGKRIFVAQAWTAGFSPFKPCAATVCFFKEAGKLLHACGNTREGERREGLGFLSGASRRIFWSVAILSDRYGQSNQELDRENDSFLCQTACHRSAESRTNRATDRPWQRPRRVLSSRSASRMSPRTSSATPTAP